MTPSTDSPDDDSPNAAGDDASCPDSLILYSSLKHKIDPKSMLKLKNEISVTYANTATKDTSPDSIIVTPHTPNVSTAPYSASTTAENKMSVRQLLDGQ